MLNELEDILAFVKWWKDQAKQRSFLGPMRSVPQASNISDETWKAFSDGGELQWLRNPLLLQNIALTYAKINYVKFLSEKYMDFMLNPNLLNLPLSLFLIPKLGRAMIANMEDLEISIEETIALIKENISKK